MVRSSGCGTDRGVSPVIDVVLMVAITVLLAVSAGYVVFGMADETKETSPQVAITPTYNQTHGGVGPVLELEFVSGDTLEEKNVYFILQDAVVVDRATGGETPTEIDGNQIQSQVGSEVTAGATMEIDASAVDHSFGPDDYLDLSDATVRLVWDPASEDIQESETIWRWSKR